MAIAYIIYVAILGFIIGTLMAQNSILKAKLKRYEDRVIFLTREQLNSEIDEMLEEKID